MEGPIDGTDWSVWHLDEESDGYPVGTPYYQNTVTQTMLWDKPAELLEAEASAQAAAEEAEPPTPSKEEMMAAMKKGKPPPRPRDHASAFIYLAPSHVRSVASTLPLAASMEALSSALLGAISAQCEPSSIVMTTLSRFSENGGCRPLISPPTCHGSRIPYVQMIRELELGSCAKRERWRRPKESGSELGRGVTDQLSPPKTPLHCAVVASMLQLNGGKKSVPEHDCAPTSSAHQSLQGGLGPRKQREGAEAHGCLIRSGGRAPCRPGSPKPAPRARCPAP